MAVAVLVSISRGAASRRSVAVPPVESTGAAPGIFRTYYIYVATKMGGLVENWGYGERTLR